MLKGFISYSHEDREECLQLAKHLDPLRELGLIDFWADQQIFPGSDWAKSIDEALDACEVMAVLVSVESYQASGVHYELKRALERERDGTCRVVPVLLKSFMWRAWKDLYRKQPFPEWNRFLDVWEPQDAGYLRTAERFGEFAEYVMREQS